ncbi:hypothetical protein [Chryseobacterium taichungense]|uniref:hypothetical protein n=1 Tax=Chryseobacterium taichungense TaxID=295069 RepID=UPI0028B1B21D|nr:hypothetical protein [Chryseobacterium taichungense]
MEAISIKSYNTFIKTLHELVEFGFIIMIQKSKNQYSANVIALSKINKANNKALDEALIKHSTMQFESTEQSTIESTVQSIDSIDKQTYNSTNLPINNSIEADASTKKSSDEIFEEDKSSKTLEEMPQKKGSGSKKKYFSAEDFKKVLLNLGADEKDIDDWINIRRQKRAVFTENAIKLVQDECEKYGLEFKQAVKYSAKYGWQGFEYEWYLNKKEKENGKSISNNTSKGSGNRTENTSMGQGGKISAASLLANRARKQNAGNGESGNFSVET